MFSNYYHAEVSKDYQLHEFDGELIEHTITESGTMLAISLVAFTDLLSNFPLKKSRIFKKFTKVLVLPEFSKIEFS